MEHDPLTCFNMTVLQFSFRLLHLIVLKAFTVLTTLFTKWFQFRIWLYLFFKWLLVARLYKIFVAVLAAPSRFGHTKIFP